MDEDPYKSSWIYVAFTHERRFKISHVSVEIGVASAATESRSLADFHSDSCVQRGAEPSWKKLGNNTCSVNAARGP